MICYTIINNVAHHTLLISIYEGWVKTISLPIDECEEWIWDILDCTKDCGFEYISDEDKEFLIFNTNDFFADTKGLQKIKRLTGMILVQMSTHNCQTQLWFVRPRLLKRTK
jgi:hypothetical protein